MPDRKKSRRKRAVTAWHAVELEILRDQLTPLGCRLSAPVAVGEQPPEIDAVVDSPQVFPHQAGTPWLLMNLFRAHNVLEIKSVAESFTARMFYKLAGYTNLYLWQEDLQETETAAIALVTHVPREVLKQFRWRKLARGFYQLKREVLYSVVAVNELPVRPEYYSLLMLSSGQKREEFLEAILRGGETYYLDYALLTSPEEVYDVATKIGVLPMRTLEENVRYLIAHGDLDPTVLAREIIRERGAEALAREVIRERGAEALAREIIRERGAEALVESLDTAEKEVLARRLLAELDAEAVRHLLEERSQTLSPG